jgi:tetratricopeptide (TPR) repeat protein
MCVYANSPAARFGAIKKPRNKRLPGESACPTARQSGTDAFVCQPRDRGDFFAVARFACLVLWLACAAWCQQPPAVEEVLRHAIALHQAGDVAGAIPEYRAYLKQVPGNVMARSNLGAALSRAGLYEEAIVEYKKALESQPGNAPVRLNLALAYYKAVEISQAAAELARVVAEQPSNRQAIFLLADCDLRLGENKKVIELLSPLEPQSPDDKALIYLLGTALIRDQQTERGQVLVDRILRDGDSAEARLLMGATKMSVHDYAGALPDLKKAVVLNPQLPDVYSYYGMALASTGDTPGAMVAFRKELESNPNDYTSNMQLGVLLKQDQDYAEARHCFERALGVRPGDATVRYQLATLDLEEGRTKEALTELEKLTREVPAFVAAHVSLATAYYRLQRKEDGDKERATVLRLNAEKQATEPGVTGK